MVDLRQALANWTLPNHIVIRLTASGKLRPEVGSSFIMASHSNSSRRTSGADSEPETKIGDFVRGREIGKGSFATVYLASHRVRNEQPDQHDFILTLYRPRDRMPLSRLSHRQSSIESSKRTSNQRYASSRACSIHTLSLCSHASKRQPIFI